MSPRPDPTSKAKAITSARARVLVIDDEAQMRRALHRMLREHEVEAFDDAREALGRLASGARYDIVLCDLTMPKMSGVAFFHALAEVAPLLRDRVVFLTGAACSPEAREIIAAFAVEIIQKPFEVDAVRAVVASHAGRR